MRSTGAGTVLRTVYGFCIVSIWISACSVPSLETPQCTEARNLVKRFYSVHLGNDMRPSREQLVLREPFLTDDLRAKVSLLAESSVDYFTGTDNYPRAFRVGACRAVNENRAELTVLLLWHEEVSEQREIRVEAVRVGEAWLIENVTQ